MRINNFLIFPLMICLTSCAGNRVAGDKNSQTEFVEISNPGLTMSPNAPATIWVPKSSVENGPPRGSEVIKMAYASVKNSPPGAVARQNSSPATATAPGVSAQAESSTAFMRNRVTVLETGHNRLAVPFEEKLRILPGSPVIAISPEIGEQKILSRDERAVFAVNAWQDSGANVSLFILVPDGFAPGRYLSAEMYDGMGAGLIGRVDAVIPSYDAKDPAGRNSAVAAATALLAERSRDAIALLPWYARIVAIEDGRIYINAGHEAGINIGQKLNILRGGKVVQGLGFAPGTVVGVVEISGFIGSNGAAGTVKDGVRVNPTDIIALQ